MQRFSPQAVEAFLDAIPEALLLVDEGGVIRYLNRHAGRLFGYSPEDLLGEVVERLLPESLIEAHRDHRRAYLRDGPRPREMGQRRVLQGRRCDGSHFPVEVSLSPVFLDETVYVLGLVREAVERLEWGRCLEQRQRAVLEEAAWRGRLSRLMSERLQRPMRQIRQYAELLEQRHGRSLDALGRECLESLCYAARRTERQLAGLQRYLRLAEEGLARAPVALDAVLQEVRRGLRFLIDDREATVQVEGDLPTVEGDFALCVELFRQLLDNALTHGGASPWVVVRQVDQDARWVVVSVRDDGPGVPEALRERLFEPFATAQPHSTGLGMGLAMAQRIAQVHGGDLWWAGGAEFRVRLPRAD